MPQFLSAAWADAFNAALAGVVLGAEGTEGSLVASGSVTAALTSPSPMRATQLAQAEGNDRNPGLRIAATGGPPRGPPLIPLRAVRACNRRTDVAGRQAR